MVGLLETKVKEKNVNTIAGRIFPGWQWIHNFSLNLKGRIWVAWKPKVYEVKLISMIVPHFKDLS